MRSRVLTKLRFYVKEAIGAAALAALCIAVIFGMWALSPDADPNTVPVAPVGAER